MTIITATVSTVKIGLIEIEGLMLSDGSFGVALQQAALLFSVRQDNAQRDFKALLGKEFQFVKVKTNRNTGTKQNRPENYLSIEQLREVIIASADKGNQQAKILRDSLVGLSLTQLFSDSFGVKFEADDRQKYLETRMAGKVTRRTLTDSIDSYVQTHAVSVNYGHWIYSNVSDCLNLGLFGKKASKLCIERGCNKNELRDTHDEVTLARIDKIEAVAMIQIDNGMEPIEAMKFTLSTVFRIAC